MRFIIREQDFEKPLAAGKFHYYVGDSTTGVKESWRLTEVIDGYRFLRIDFDARDADERVSELYHLTLSPEELPVRLKFRSYRKDVAIVGDMLFDTGNISVNRDVNGKRQTDQFTVESSCSVMLPGLTGQGLVAKSADQTGKTEVISIDNAGDCAPSLEKVTIMCHGSEKMIVTGQLVPAQSCLISWSSNSNKIWLDDHGWPIKLIQNDGLMAIERSYIRYQSAY